MSESIDLDAIEREATRLADMKTLSLSGHWTCGYEDDGPVCLIGSRNLFWARVNDPRGDSSATATYICAVRNSDLESHCLALVAECRRLEIDRRLAMGLLEFYLKRAMEQAGWVVPKVPSHEFLRLCDAAAKAVAEEEGTPVNIEAWSKKLAADIVDPVEVPQELREVPGV